jgi:hypothetical protein
LEPVDKYVTVVPKPKANLLPLVAVLATCLVLGLGVGAWWWINNKPKAATAQAAVTNIEPVLPAAAASKLSTEANAPPSQVAASPAAIASPSVAPPMSAISPAASPVPAASPASAEPRAERVNLKPLTGAEVQTMVQHNYQHILSCLDAIDKSHAPSLINAQVTIENTGKVSAVTFNPSLDNPTMESCLMRVMMNMRARKHRGGQMRVTVPLQVKMN